MRKNIVAVTVDLQLASEQAVPEPVLFETWAQAALQQVDEDCELSIRLVDNDESAELNEAYRGKAYATNVLSFPFDSPVPMSPRLLGDLVICIPVVEKEALEQNKAVNEHWAHMVVHGCLHLLGYDHIVDEEAEVMEALEVSILKSINIANPYLEREL
jgi:probable rRNA maturation factor